MSDDPDKTLAQRVEAFLCQPYKALREPSEDLVRDLVMEAERLRIELAQERPRYLESRESLAAIHKALANADICDPNPLPPMWAGALSTLTTYGLATALIRQRDAWIKESDNKGKALADMTAQRDAALKEVSRLHDSLADMDRAYADARLRLHIAELDS